MTDIDLATEQLRRDLDHTREDLARLAAALAERAEVSVKTGARIRARRARKHVKEAGPAAANAASDAAHAAASAAADAAQTTVHSAEEAVVKVREHPTPLFAILAVALALGALAAWFARTSQSGSEQPHPPQFTPPYTPQPASRV
jgi:hypothetical protein